MCQSVVVVAGFLISSNHLSFLGFHLEEINKNIYKWKKFEKLPNCLIVIMFFFRFPHSPGAEQSAQAPVGQHVQQSHFWNTTRSLHQHDQTGPSDPLEE